MCVCDVSEGVDGGGFAEGLGDLLVMFDLAMMG